MARKCSEQKAIREGFSYHCYEYEDGVQLEMAKLGKLGYETRLLRERTDTRGLPMYSIWKRMAV